MYNVLLFNMDVFMRDLHILVLFWLHEPLMRQSNCAAPIPPPPGSHGIRGKMCVRKKGGALENKVKKVGALKNEVIKVIS